MEKDVLSAVDNTILDICDEIKEKKNLANARAELIIALAELLKARAVNFDLTKHMPTVEELPLLKERKKWLDEMKKSGKL